MDIMLEDSTMDGIEIAHRFNQICKVPIIYLTSLRDKTIRDRAKPTQPAYYLIKPWNTFQLEIALDFALYNFVHEKEAEINHSLSAHTGTEQNFLLYKDAFFVKTKNNRQVKVLIDELLYVKGAKESVEIFTAQGRRFHSANLKSFSQQVSHPNIIRVHRSYIVNSSKVEAIQDSFLILGEVSIPIGPSFKSNVDQSFNRLKAD